MAIRCARRRAIASLFLAAAFVPVSALAQGPIVRASCPVVADTLIRQRTPTTSYDTYPKGWAHSAVEGTAGSWIEALLRFDLTDCLPANAQLADAALRVWVTNPSAYPFDLFELLQPFSATASWNAYAQPAGAGWAQSGAMGAGSDYGARVGSIASAQSGALSIPLARAIVQGWAGAATASIVVRPTGSP